LDPVFIIGKGTANNARSNAMTILKNGKTGINTNLPLAMLHVKDSSVVFTGPNPLPVTPGAPSVSGGGTRMMWYPDKAAFRTGNVNSTQWDKINIGNYSFASGKNTTARGSISTAIGESTTAFGYASVAMGINTLAKSYAALVIGRYNDTTSISSNGWNLLDPVFIVGNGGSNNTRSNAITVLKDGRTGINTISPQAMLHVDSSVVFTGNATIPATQANPPISGAGTRMMWYPDKAAFRTGNVSSAQWDKINIGLYSFASGWNTTASGGFSIAMGEGATASSVSSIAIGLDAIASGPSSVSIGNHTTASGHTSTALGGQTTASALRSTAMGGNSIASGNFSTAMGSYTIAKPYAAVVIGQYNDTTTLSPTNWNSLDPVFVVGNGLNSGSRGNAMTVLKNGNVGIRTINPGYLLEVDGTAGKPGGGSWSNSSDIRLKQDVQPYKDGLNSLLNINPVTYHYNELSGYDSSLQYVGVIAQELQQVAPYMVNVSEKKMKDGTSGYLQVDNSAMTYLLINAVKEQQKIITDQQHRISAIENELKEIKQMLETH
ncbi:MAG: tail fiber domain-containing protein, partial [Saprospiraceae bacterium]